jgi:hypothetical protein
VWSGNAPCSILETMRLYLQTVPVNADAPRYVQITLEQDLLGGWTLYRESGTQGGSATLKREQYLERDEAIAAFEKSRDAQLKRGFRLMFSQGQEGPYGR